MKDLANKLNNMFLDTTVEHILPDLLKAMHFYFEEYKPDDQQVKTLTTEVWKISAQQERLKEKTEDGTISSTNVQITNHKLKTNLFLVVSRLPRDFKNCLNDFTDTIEKYNPKNSDLKSNVRIENDEIEQVGKRAEKIRKELETKHLEDLNKLKSELEITTNNLKRDNREIEEEKDLEQAKEKEKSLNDIWTKQLDKNELFEKTNQQIDDLIKDMPRYKHLTEEKPTFIPEPINEIKKAPIVKEPVSAASILKAIFFAWIPLFFLTLFAISKINGYEYDSQTMGYFFIGNCIFGLIGLIRAGLNNSKAGSTFFWMMAIQIVFLIIMTNIGIGESEDVIASNIIIAVSLLILAIILKTKKKA